MANVTDPPGPITRTRRKLAAGAPLSLADPEGRPDIRCTVKIHEVHDDMIVVLQRDPDLYQRSRELVHVIRCDEPDESGWISGAPTIRNAPLSWLTDRVSRNGRCIVFSKDDVWKPCPPPSERVKCVLERGEWAGIRHLESIVEAPTMRPDGTIVQVAGYDRTTRVLYTPNTTFRLVADSPSHSDAVISYVHLADLFRDFPYVAPSHMSAVVSAILTLVGRPAIAGSIPCWLFDASSPRAGKSLQMDVVSIVATGRKASRMTYPEEDEELEKVLGAYALDGDRIVPFDNVARAFGGAALDKVVTATDNVDLRILGRTLKLTLPWRAMVMASGNNMSCRGDMLPRVLAPRIESPLENPETRQGLRDLRAFALENRAALVIDALTILRAYVVAGRPAQPIAKWGGFDEWVSLVASALVWVGAPDPTGARRGLVDDEDPTRAAEATIISGWDKLCGGRPSLSVSGAISALYPGHKPDPDAPPDGLDDMREAVEHVTRSKSGYAPSARALGDALRRMKSRVISGKKIVPDGQTGKVARWRTFHVT